MKHKINIIHSYATQLDVSVTPTRYAPNDRVYFLPDNKTFLQFGRDMHKAEKEKNEWIRKYDRLLQGLNYWKNKALEKE